MASLTNLEERFNAAVRTIQSLPSHGAIQPSNLTKLIFYGLYKQATVGPCNQSQPSLFNYVARAKWEAWHRYQSMTKEQAMSEYIDEIRKMIATIPETNELIEFKQLIGLSKKPEDQSFIEQESSTQDVTADNRNDSSSSSSSSASLTSSTPSSDIDEYDDPSGLILVNTDEIPANNNQIQQQSINPTRSSHSPYLLVNQNRTNSSIRHSTRTQNNHSNRTSNVNYQTHASHDQVERAILTALSTLQQDINNILQRLNRLETLADIVQQNAKSTSEKSDSSPRWLPLAGFRRPVIAFILVWPFAAFMLMRLFLHAKISIRFRRQRLF